MTDQWAMGKEGGLIFYPLLSTQQGAGDNRKHEPRPRLLPVSQSGESQVYIPQLTSPPNASGQRQWYLSTPSGMHVPPFWQGWESQGPTREIPVKSQDDRQRGQSTD
jgi:hypothetical protein